MKKKKKLVRRIVNNIRMLEHATCTAGGCIIGLEDDIPLLARKLGVNNSLEGDIWDLIGLSKSISEAAADLHTKLAEHAKAHKIKIPTKRVVNTGGGSGKNDP